MEELSIERCLALLQFENISKSHQQVETVCFQREVCINFVRWGVTSLSIIRSKEVSAIQRSLCTVNYRVWLGPQPLVDIVEVSVIEGVHCQKFHCS